MSLAATLAERGDNAAAIEEYRKVLEAKPDYVGARASPWPGCWSRPERSRRALEQLRQVTKEDAQDPEVFERIGDLEAARHNPAEARAAYQSALALKPSGAARKRIDNKLKSVDTKRERPPF